MERTELTYILGAGASYQSIPIVKSFSNRFSEFLDYIDVAIVGDDRFPADEKKAFRLLHNLGKNLLNSFESHQSFDTYFKKLFHTKQIEKIKEGKKILHLYFVWEHLSPVSSKPMGNSEMTFWKQSKVDKRYDALIAGLLKPVPDKAEPYCKVNFITWNYDLNLFYSLKNYFLPNGTSGDFFKMIDRKNGVWEIGDRISVINMNGYFYCSNFNSLFDINNVIGHRIIYDKINRDYFDNTHHDDDAELIRFAWEKNDNSLVAKSKITKSNSLVVVGYTFPLYNRLVDLSYLDKNTLISIPVIIQDPNAEALRQNILDYYGLIGYSVSGLIAQKNCDNFYIPSNIFGVKDGRGEYSFI